MRISLLQFFKKIHKFALCEIWAILFQYIVQLFGQKYLPCSNFWTFHFISAIFWANLAI